MMRESRVSGLASSFRASSLAGRVFQTQEGVEVGTLEVDHVNQLGLHLELVNLVRALFEELVLGIVSGQFALDVELQLVLAVAGGPGGREKQAKRQRCG